MEMKEKLELIAATLDVEDHDEVKPDTILADLPEWDSMGTISIIAMLDKKFSKVLSADQIDKLVTVQDILDLM